MMKVFKGVDQHMDLGKNLISMQSKEIEFSMTRHYFPPFFLLTLDGRKVVDNQRVV